jgi:predicted transcriptional regulator
MLIDKYLLCLDDGLKFVSKRHDLPRPLTINDLKVLVITKRQRNGVSDRYMGVMAERTFYHCAHYLESIKYVKEHGRGKYTLTEDGRVFLAQVRRYLVNIRL